MKLKAILTTVCATLTALCLTESAFAQEANPATPATTESKTETAFPVTPLEQSIIEAALIATGFQDFTAENPFLPKTYPGITKLSINKFSEALHENPFKADKLFKGKWFLVTGQLEGVEARSKEAVIKLQENAGDFFSPTAYAHIARTPELEEMLSNLDKKDRVALICQVEGSQSIGPNSLINCVQLIDAVRAAYPYAQSNLITALEANPPRENVAKAAAMVLSFEELMDEQQKETCLRGGGPCYDVVMAVYDKMDETKPPKGFLERGYTTDMLEKK